jgi:hypothetical protein
VEQEEDKERKKWRNMQRYFDTRKMWRIRKSE